MRRNLIGCALAALALAGPAWTQTVGPGGESATPSSEITLSDADLAGLKDKGHKAALLWHTSSDFVNAVTSGATDEFDRAGIPVVVTTDAAFDAAKQRSDIETALAAGPDVVLALPLDPVTSAEAFREADYPDMAIVAEAGIADPARAEEIAAAMLLQNPDLDGIYVTWAEPADGVLAALRASGNTHTKVVTLDLSEPVALDMVKGGVVGIVADEAYESGRTMAATGMKALLGEASPPFIVAPALTVTKENVAEGWQQSLHRDAPQSVLDAAK